VRTELADEAFSFVLIDLLSTESSFKKNAGWWLCAVFNYSNFQISVTALTME
jgi:hypothetical protein